MTRKTTAFIRDEEENVLRFEPIHDFHGGAEDAIDDVDHKVKAAQERLTLLRQQQEEIEREKKILEDLRQKQERFATGKRDVLEKLSRSAASLDRELYDAQKLVEEISITRDTFSRHLDVLRALQPEKWPRHQVAEELENALAAIEDAEDDYTKSIRRISSFRKGEAHEANGERRAEDIPAAVAPLAGDDWNAWLRRGLAFPTPMIGALLIGIILVRVLF